MKNFLGRTLDTNTMTWKYPDGSGGSIPDECRIEFLVKASRPFGGAITALNHLWDWKKRLGIKEQ